jgi:multisubunit Na+/H+ antiporter MnhF subunit
LSLIAMTKVLTGPLAKVADAARTFVILNSAAAVAFVKFVTGGRVAWVR